MARHTYRVRFAPDGNGSGFLVDIEEAPEPKASGTPPKTAKEQGARNADGEPMTESQRRYLFRLLAAQGTEGKAAEDHLKSYFEVASLRDITKPLASGYIDELVKDQREARGGA